MTWGTEIEQEVKRRINVCVWAYAYEIRNDPLVSDDVFDTECLLVDLDILTGHDELDTFFMCHFAPHTGMWIHSHPDLKGIERIYTLKKNRNGAT